MRSSIYLASQSPRRRELLRQIDVHFELLLFRGGGRADPELDEAPYPDESPEHYVERLALMKAEGGVRRVQMRRLVRHPVLGADTALDLDGTIIGKPTSRQDAFEILSKLSGRTHRVLTAVSLADAHRTESLLSVSEVSFRKLSDIEIRRYVETGESIDKAGAYGIQGRAAVFVSEIRGSYSGIMGLPLHETANLLDRFGMPLFR